MAARERIMTGRMYKRLARSKAKWWLMLGGFLGAGMLPCPECGTPIIFHVWPLAGMVLVAQAIKKRAQKAEQDRSETTPAGCARFDPPQRADAGQ